MHYSSDNRDKRSIARYMFPTQQNKICSKKKTYIIEVKINIRTRLVFTRQRWPRFPNQTAGLMLV